MRAANSWSVVGFGDPENIGNTGCKKENKRGLIVCTAAFITEPNLVTDELIEFREHFLEFTPTDIVMLTQMGDMAQW